MDIRSASERCVPVTPKYAPPCPHRCCVDEDVHEHSENAAECPDCIGLADVHPLALRAQRIAQRKADKQ